ncbi:hypothetical protein [Arsukibacterium sp.]|uniref:hypothetical protein n=1 Tax=Arsukibacterium sp. TaxID=1977258 RepID=UPI00299D5571|nr:hypothetical protein [Arsukibacterium sp.]MDX1678110.1 hypothetical protein [Arsukibacterium sp.]
MNRLRQMFFSSSVAGTVKELAILTFGIYLALWMENEVQTWKDQRKESEYIGLLAADLRSDQKELGVILSRIEQKLQTLQTQLQAINDPRYTSDPEFAAATALTGSEAVTNYHFFSPQDFTLLSLRESGDFKLLRNQEIKSQLLAVHKSYEILHQLQQNYLQGLDEEFIPLLIRSVDMMAGTLQDPQMPHKILFKNMIAFALNETSQRKQFIERTLRKIEALQVELNRALQ